VGAEIFFFFSSLFLRLTPPHPGNRVFFSSTSKTNCTVTAFFRFPPPPPPMRVRFCNELLFQTRLLRSRFRVFLKNSPPPNPLPSSGDFQREACFTYPGPLPPGGVALTICKACVFVSGLRSSFSLRLIMISFLDPLTSKPSSYSSPFTPPSRRTPSKRCTSVLLYGIYKSQPSLPFSAKGNKSPPTWEIIIPPSPF